MGSEPTHETPSGPGPSVTAAEAPTRSRRVERLKITFLVLVVLVAVFVIVRSHPSGSATGRIEATGSPHGGFVLQPRTCLLGDHWGFDGVWVIREMEEAGSRRGFRGGLRIERDGEGRWQATLENPNVCEVFTCRQRPVALEHCRVHDLFVGETTLFLRRSGHARLECAFPEGGTLDVSLEFRRCAAPPTGGDAEP